MRQVAVAVDGASTRCLSSVAVPTATPTPTTTSTAARGRRSSGIRHGGHDQASPLPRAPPRSPWPERRTATAAPHRPPSAPQPACPPCRACRRRHTGPEDDDHQRGEGALSPSRTRSDGGSTAGADRPVTRPPRAGRRPADRPADTWADNRAPRGRGGHPLPGLMSASTTRRTPCSGSRRMRCTSPSRRGKHVKRELGRALATLTNNAVTASRRRKTVRGATCARRGPEDRTARSAAPRIARRHSARRRR